MKHLPYTDAFVDESVRGRRYTLVCVLAQARALAPLRGELRSLVVGGNRLHFHQELNRTRTDVLDRFASMDVRIRVVVAVRGHAISEFAARDACMTEVVRHLQSEAVPHLTIESRQDDSDDQRTIGRARSPEPRLVFDHKRGELEPMLWIADAVAWAYGAGGEWRRRAAHLIEDVTELRP